MKTTQTRKPALTLLATAAAALMTAGAAHAQISDGVIKIGVMNDMSGLYADIGGPGSVLAARMAVEDFAPEKKGMKVEVVSADHQNKPDVGSTIARTWYDVDKVDAIFDVPTSSVALAVLMPQLDKLWGIPNPPKWHPEIDTGLHTLSVLQQAALHQQPLSVRWACLLHDLGKGVTPEEEWPRHIGHEHKGLELIKAVNERFKAPRECQELALLVGQYHTHAHKAQELKASTLLELLQSFDVFRRPQRFEEFIAACEMDARGRLGLESRPYPQADYLRGAANAARSVAVQPLLEQGFKGPELGEALRLERLKAIKTYKEQHAS